MSRALALLGTLPIWEKINITPKHSDGNDCSHQNDEPLHIGITERQLHFQQATYVQLMKW